MDEHDWIDVYKYASQEKVCQYQPLGPNIVVVATAKTDVLKLKEPEEIETFTEAVNSSKQGPGIVNMLDPQYTFKLGEESYYLWINKESGTIMNTKDTHTIYTLPSSSVEKVYEYVSKK